MKSLITNLMYIVFPILLYFISIAYNKSISNCNNKLILEISLLLSLYFIMVFGEEIYGLKPFYLLNVPLYVSYVNKRNSTSLLMSIIIIFYLNYYFDINIYLLILNYCLLFLIYKFDKKYFIYSFNIISLIFIFFYIQNISYIYIVLIYLLFLIIVINVVNYIDKLMNFYMKLKDVQNNKQLQDSLFKISHEVKNPIAVCKGYLELIDGTKEKYDKYVPIIQKEINHSLSILKDFSSIGKLKIDKDVMDIGLLLDESISNFNMMFEQKNILLEYVNKYDEILIMGDYSRLEEVVINILKNSVEALDSIDNPKIRIVVEKNKNRVYIRFFDNGCGISDKDINKIGNPFFTTKNNGTGLGTYLSREIVVEHNGLLDFYSKENVGTQVLVKLPLIDIEKEL